MKDEKDSKSGLPYWFQVQRLRVGNCVFLEFENIGSLQICRNEDMVGDCFQSQLQMSSLSGVDVIPVVLTCFRHWRAEMIATFWNK